MYLSIVLVLLSTLVFTAIIRVGREDSVTCVNVLGVFMLEELKENLATPIRIICILYLQSEVLPENEIDLLFH